MKIISTTLVVFVVGSILVIGVTKLFPESHVLAWEHPELPGDILGVSNIRRLPETQTSFDEIYIALSELAKKQSDVDKVSKTPRKPFGFNQ